MQPVYPTSMTLAQAMHFALREYMERHQPRRLAEPALQPWGLLAPRYQDAAVAVAEHMNELLDAIGCVAVPQESARKARLKRLAAHEYAGLVEPLARMLHLRYVNDQLHTRWHFAPGPRDEAALTDPNITSWEEAQEAHQRLCLHRVRSFPALYERAGLRIVRQSAITPESELASQEVALSAHLRAFDLKLVARGIHEAYVARRRSAAQGTEPLPPLGSTQRMDVFVSRQQAIPETLPDNPSLRQWESLPEYLRFSNIEAARLAWVRFRAVGLDIVPLSHPGKALSAADLQEKLEVLAEASHVHWMNERVLRGWTYAPGPKDMQRRTHPDLRPWQELGEAERDKDREQVMDLPGILDRAGLKIVPLQPPTGTILRTFLR